MSYAALWKEHLRPQWPKALLLAAALLAGALLQLVAPQIVRRFIDDATAGAGLDRLIRLALLFLAAAVAKQGLGALSAYLSADVGWRATNSLRATLFGHALGLDMRFHKDRTPGALIERIDGDVTHLANFLSQFAAKVTVSLLLVVGILVLLWIEDWRVGAALTGYVVIVVLVLLERREAAVPATQVQREANGRVFGFIEERLTGIEDIRANGAGAHVMKRLGEIQRDWYRVSRRAWNLQVSVYAVMLALSSAGQVGVLALGIWLYFRGALTLGGVYLLFNYMAMLEDPLDEISQQMQDFQRAGAGARRARELLATKPAVADGSAAPLAERAHEVRFENVSFAYADQPVLKGVSFTLAAGETLGLLGRTGSGKTTLVRLLCRLYDPTEGRILLDGIDTRIMKLSHVQARVGLVTQDVQLFSGTIRDNLTFFDPAIPDERLLEAFRALGVLDWIQSLPEGLDTRLGANGAGLSAGEGQLLAFARLFLQDPGVVIMDEPSSRLDPATERRLTRATQKLLQGRTGIVIAHRLETVRKLDKIMVLSGGQIAEFGPQEALASDPGSLYHAMLALSSGGGLDEPLDASLERLGV